MDYVAHSDNLLQLIISICGLCASIFSLKRSCADYRLLKKLRLNGARRVVALGACRDELSRIFAHGILSYTGAIITFKTIPHNAMMEACVLGLAVILTLQSVMRHRDRQLVLDAIEHLDQFRAE